MKKLYLLLFLGIFLISLVSAAIPNLPTQKLNQDVNLIQTSPDATYQNISRVTLGNGTIIILDASMTKSGTSFNYTLSKNYVTTIGTYCVDGYGDDSDDPTWNYCFNVNYFGKDLTTSQGIIYSILVGILLFIFVATIFGINQLPSKNNRDNDGKIISINWLKYLRSSLWFFEWIFFIAILYLTSNLAFAYLSEQLFAKILFYLFRACLWLTIPFIVVWFLWIFVNAFEDVKLNKQMQQGFYGGYD